MSAVTAYCISFVAQVSFVIYLVHLLPTELQAFADRRIT